jgi:hypothetical protein
MESSPFLHPGFIVPTVMGLIGFIAWLIRLEGKVAQALIANAKLEAENEKLWSELERHKENQDIHFNQKVSAEVEKGNTRRFETIEHQLGEINRKLDSLTRSKT